ncbi:hypothetical protein HJC23_010620 [Cyclotella cryptica]|uniref:Uncharacterized protein n=1 Tax=Cyclotella cryptica TaxID=29204 RepID=A0ABD3NKP0_9STRA|eukprot:CCRYP_020664-RA/>CCRYP_020664-RA protein AED:0.00 eAED:0.00 QI:105/1/1/1/1/1/2/96/435
MNSIGEAASEEKHLDWSAKQGRILTDRGSALSYYSEENGFPFSPEVSGLLHDCTVMYRCSSFNHAPYWVWQELPHYHLERGDSNSIFRNWSKEFLQKRTKCPIVGAWKRPLFAGKWEHSTEEDEEVFNIQTSTLFIDLRIPRSKPVCKWENMETQSIDNGTGNYRQILQSFSDHDLRLYARQHVFGGISVLSAEHTGKSLPLCTRHHCIDWNYVTGKPRPRPNKWYIEGNQDDNTGGAPFDTWKEWSYATDENGQCYYSERWERLPCDDFGNGLRLAMRRRLRASDDKNIHVDAILVAVGDHFNYIIGREPLQYAKKYPNANTLVEIVDTAIACGDRDTAISYLSLDGGHGTISSGWVVDCSIQSWRHGTRVFDCIAQSRDSSDIKVCGDGSDYQLWEVYMGGGVWDVYECSFQRAAELELILKGTGPVSYCSRL